MQFRTRRADRQVRLNWQRPSDAAASAGLKAVENTGRLAALAFDWRRPDARLWRMQPAALLDLKFDVDTVIILGFWRRRDFDTDAFVTGGNPYMIGLVERYY